MVHAKSSGNVAARDGRHSDETASTVVLYGAGGFAREVLQIIKTVAATGTPLNCAGFLVDPLYRKADRVSGLPVLGDCDWVGQNSGVAFAIAIGSPATRRRIAERIGAGASFMTLVHPLASLGDTVALGHGCVVCAGAVATADIRVGAHVQLHANCTVGHDADIAGHVTVAPGANVGGEARIGEGAFVGSGAIILPRINIGAWSILGAGAVVTTDVPDNATVVGVPAAVIARRAPGWHLGSDHQAIERLYTGSRR